MFDARFFEAASSSSPNSPRPYSRSHGRLTSILRLIIRPKAFFGTVIVDDAFVDDVRATCRQASKALRTNIRLVSQIPVMQNVAHHHYISFGSGDRRSAAWRKLHTIRANRFSATYSSNIGATSGRSNPMPPDADWPPPPA